MKLVEVKCPSCGGKLTVEDSKTQLYKCEFCGNQFFLKEDNGTQNITNNYNIYEERKKSGNGKKWAAIAVFPLFSLLMIIISTVSRSTYNTTSTNVYSMPDQPVQTYTQAVEKVIEPPSQLYQDITEVIFDKPFGDVSEQELSQVKYLKISKHVDGNTVEYSLDDPYAVETPQTERLSFGEAEWNSRDLANFTGLIKIDMGYTLTASTDLKKLTQLKGIACQSLDFPKLADMVADPAQITELAIKNADSLEGLASFGNLENLFLGSIENCDLKELTTLKHLKTLSLADLEISDYTPISVMTGLETLQLDGETLKDIRFAGDLPALTSLSLTDTSVFSLEPLTDNTVITSLSLSGNSKMMDYQTIETLTGLTELTLNKDTSQPDPPIASLTKLNKLDISGFMSLSGLKNMQGLKELSLCRSNVDELSVLSTLNGVERLTFHSVWTSAGQPKSLDFIKGMTALKYADFCGNLDGTGWSGYQYSLEIYGDISAVFNLQQLEELYLDNGQFEIDFDRIGDSPSLRVLSLKNVGLHKNYYVESNGGMTSVWYDEVKMQDQIGFLSHFPNLEGLYLDENELTDLSFVSANPKLTRLSMRDNYITDLSPLTRAEHLEYLDVTDNPLETTGEMGAEVEVIY